MAFKAPKRTLGDVDAEAAAALISAAADMALILDTAGVIRDVSFQSDELAQELDGTKSWSGKRWADTVTPESRAKVDSLLHDAAAGASPRWRHINQGSPGREPVPVLFSAIRVRAGGQVVAFGRDLRAISALQQRLVEAQQSLERDYARLRHVEMRYRLLFEMSAEPVLVLDAFTHKVSDANPAARRLFGETGRVMVGRVFPECFDPDGARAVRELLAGVRASGRADDVRARIAGQEREVQIFASLFRQESTALLLVRLAGAPEAAELPHGKARLLKVVENAPDGFVVTSPDGRILAANAAFLDMAQLATEEQASGEPLERWLGRPGIEMGVLIANLRQRGSVRLFATTLRSDYGATAEVEVSAVAVMNGGEPVFGFVIRNIGRRLSETRTRRDLPRSVEQLTELVGRVALKDLVRETTDVIERLCIEAALELTNDNRASAAEMLGLSRQGLYAKLRRYGLGDLDVDNGSEK
jgi:transcriptional regulator PpsR